MPLEISEIGVHIAIGQAPPPPPAPAPGTTPGAPAAAGMTPAQVEALTDTCVQRVLRNLRLRGER
jgi:hypothetical protein